MVYIVELVKFTKMRLKLTTRKFYEIDPTSQEHFGAELLCNLDHFRAPK